MPDDTSRSILAWPMATQQPPATNGELTVAAGAADLQRIVGRPFAPGRSGNPAGRKPSSRNKISELFALAMRNDFEEHGYQAIAKLRERDPASYLHLVHSMIPQATLIKCEEQSEKVEFDNMTDVEFVEFMEETEGDNSSPAISKMRRAQAFDMVMAHKVGTIREAMTLLGAKLD